ncbi:MAG: hypothetical protein U0X92_15385 [Anaerolineales bacterium]
MSILVLNHESAAGRQVRAEVEAFAPWSLERVRVGELSSLASQLRDGLKKLDG